MNDPYPPLPETLSRIKELCQASGRSTDDVLRVADLSRATGLVEADVRTLLSGGELTAPDPEDMVRQRVQFLWELNSTEQTQAQDLRELAAAINKTTVWARKIVAGEAKPNLVVGHALCKYYRVANSFLTDLPEDALNRELQPVVLDLEIEVDPEQALRDLNVRSISSRSAVTEQPDMSELARMVANIAEELDIVKKRLETPEETR
ncbi:hypothetical protein ABZ687_28910 [Streptomyces ardesiacus]|uniref:hypothetical protein n=1 Tax=Streptomyces ardesiacus TaxID=285564 RepID=UPI0034111C11